MIKEDRVEKSKEFVIGLAVLSASFWLLWQWWFGNGIFEGKPLVEGTYGSLATEMFQLVVFLIGQVGLISLGLFRVGFDLLKGVGSFFFGDSMFGSKQSQTVNEFNFSMPTLNPQVQEAVRSTNVVNLPSNKTKKASKFAGIDESPTIFRTNESGVLIRDLELEKVLLGPVSKEELAQDAVDALMSGDMDRLSERFNQLHGVENESKSKA